MQNVSNGVEPFRLLMCQSVDHFRRLGHPKFDQDTLFQRIQPTCRILIGAGRVPRRVAHRSQCAVFKVHSISQPCHGRISFQNKKEPTDYKS